MKNSIENKTCSYQIAEGENPDPVTLTRIIANKIDSEHICTYKMMHLKTKKIQSNLTKFGTNPIVITSN